MKCSLITGASRGIGKAIAIKLSTMGNPVIINYLSNEMAANATKNEIIARGGGSGTLAVRHFQSARHRGETR